MSEIHDNIIKTKVHSIDENEPDEPENLTVTETKKPIDLHEKNAEFYNREYIFPLLAKDHLKMKREYGKEGFEKLFKRFKKMADPSIPYRKVVTSIVRIRTLANKEQSLGEYIYYLANITGFQKHFDPETSEITHFESARLLNVPFGVDKMVNMQPDYSGGKFKGYKPISEYHFFTTKFVPNTSIDTIIENSDMQEGISIQYGYKDMGKSYGGYTKEELSTLRSDRLKARNEKKEMGSDIKPEDTMSLVSGVVEVVQDQELNTEVTQNRKRGK
jgi:hypothetical protein